MTATEKNEIAEAIRELAKAVEKLSAAISMDEPLNYSIARELNKIAEAII